MNKKKRAEEKDWNGWVSVFAYHEQRNDVESYPHWDWKCEASEISLSFLHHKMLWLH